MKKRTVGLLLLVMSIVVLGIHFFNASSRCEAETVTLDPSWEIKMTGNVEGISFSGDDKYLAVGTGGGKVYFFELSQGETPVWTYQCNGSVEDVSVSMDGNYLVAGDDIGYVYLFEKSGNLLWVCTSAHPETVRTVSISGDGEYVVAGTANWYGAGGKVYFFNRSSNVPLWDYQTGSSGGTPWVEDVSVSFNGSCVAVGAHDGVHILNKTGGLSRYYDLQSWVFSAPMSSNGRYVVAGTIMGANGTVSFIDTTNETVAWTYYADGVAIWSTDISSTGDYVVAGDMGAYPTVNSAVIFFRKEDSVPLWKYTTSMKQGPIHVSISADGNFIAAGTANGVIYYFHCSSSNPLWTYEIQNMDAYEIHCIDVSSDSKHVAAGTWGGLDQYLYLFAIIENPPVTVDDYDGLWHTADFTITLNATDDLSGVAETYYRFNDGPIKNVSIHGQPLIITEGDNNTLEYWSVDNADNEELPHKVLTGIKLDKTAPTIETPSRMPDGDVLPDQEVKVSVNVTDVNSGVKNVTLSYKMNNGAAWTDLLMNYNSSTGLYEDTIPGQPAETLVEYKIIVHDNAGNPATKDGTEPHCSYQVVPEFPSFLILPLYMIATLATAVYVKKRKKA